MSLTDPIADALTMIRNGSRARKESVEVKASKLLAEILDILKKQGFIKEYRFIDDKKQGSYKVYLKYHKGKVAAITGIKKLSLPGRRFYIAKEDIPKVYGGLGIAILSTSKGVMSDTDARNQNVGGELLCEVW